MDKQQTIVWKDLWNWWGLPVGSKDSNLSIMCLFHFFVALCCLYVLDGMAYHVKLSGEELLHYLNKKINQISWSKKTSVWPLTYDDRAFPVAASRVWNSLPHHVTSAQSLPVCCSRLKTYLFRRSFPWLIKLCPQSDTYHYGHINRSYLLTYYLENDIITSNISRSFVSHHGRKTTGIDIEWRNYVLVTVCTG